MAKPLRPSRRVNGPKLGEFANHTHPLVVFMWQEIVRQGIVLKSLQDSSGIDTSTLHKWRKSPKGPYLPHMDAVLESLGYKLKIVRLSDEI